MTGIEDIDAVLAANVQSEDATGALAEQYYAEAMESVRDLLDFGLDYGVTTAAYVPSMTPMGSPPIARRESDYYLPTWADLVGVDEPRSWWRRVEQEILYPYRVRFDASPPVINVFELPTGQRLVNVHDRTQCGGEHCVLHNPSTHHMATWPLLWRDDIGVFERICECGVGHPDPDQFEYWHRVGMRWKIQHGCDGCCHV